MRTRALGKSIDFEVPISVFEDDGNICYLSYDNTVRCKMPVSKILVRGMHPVIRVLVNDSIELDLLVDTGSSRTVLPATIFGESDGTIIYIDKLCYENGICFHDIAIMTGDCAYTYCILIDEMI